MLVVTGGEPLQHHGLRGLLEDALERWSMVEVETSGIAGPPLEHERLHYNVSPKLPSVTDRWQETWAHAGTWRDTPRATFKIVVGSQGDADEAVRLLQSNAIPAERVMLMPEGLTDEQVRAHAPRVADLCKQHGYRLSPRLHIWLWGPRRGV
jgi:organic radical activating enzyme